jgi:hypothetical protein
MSKAYMKSILYLFLLLLSCSGLWGADTSAVKIRSFNTKDIEQYKKDSEYVYEKDEEPEEQNIWELFLAFLGRLFNKIFSNEQQINIYRVIFYLLMIVSLVLIVLNLMGIEVRRLFYSESKSVIIPQIAAENIREMSLDELIAEALQSGQWRLSLRYQYLKALRLLSDKELINWESGKTNMDYYYELKAMVMRQDFMEVTDLFENAWYGNHEVTQQDYFNSKGRFERFYEDVKSYRG